VGESTTDRVVALEEFVRYLAAGPELGDGVVRALVLGALSPLGAVAGHLYLHDGEGSLVLVGSHGFTDEELVDFRVVSLSLPYPITQAFTSRRPVEVPRVVVQDEYPLLQPSRSASNDAAARRLEPTIVLMALPVVWQGICMGVVGVVRRESEEPPADDTYLSAVVNSVALWLGGRRPGSATTNGQRSSRSGRQLTPRQIEVLRLLAAGKSNGAIAAALGYSVSTVKSDVAGILDTLGVADRAAAVEAGMSLGLIQ